MKSLFTHHLHPSRVHKTALFASLAALAILGLDLSLAQTANAPILTAAIIRPATPEAPPVPSNQSPVGSILYPYIEVTGSCGPYYDGGPCVNLRSGPGENYPVVMKLRNGIVLKVAKTAVDAQGRGWYELIPDTEELHYPERVTSSWYVAADLVTLLYDSGNRLRAASDATTTKRIIISLSRQMLYAYDGEALFMAQSISTGLTDTPTPLGAYE